MKTRIEGRIDVVSVAERGPSQFIQCLPDEPPGGVKARRGIRLVSMDCDDPDIFKGVKRIRITIESVDEE